MTTRTTIPPWLAIVIAAVVTTGVTVYGLQHLRWVRMLEGDDAVSWRARVDSTDVPRGKGASTVTYSYRVALLDGKVHTHTRTVEVNKDLAQQLQRGQEVDIRISKAALEDSDLVANMLPTTRAHLFTGVGVFGLVSLAGMWLVVRRRDDQAA